EHHLDVIKTADHVIDLGPEGGHAGGEVVVTGAPEHIAACKESYTGRVLRAHLREEWRRRGEGRALPPRETKRLGETREFWGGGVGGLNGQTAWRGSGT